MTRSSSIVLAIALLCAAGAWLVSHRSTQAPHLSPALEMRSDAAAPAPGALESEARAPEVHPRPTRKDLTELEPIVLRFKGPRATLNLRVLDAARKDPVGDVAVRLSFGLSGTRRDEAGQEIVAWQDLTRGDPPLTDGSGRVSLRVPANRPLSVGAKSDTFVGPKW